MFEFDTILLLSFYIHLHIIFFTFFIAVCFMPFFCIFGWFFMPEYGDAEMAFMKIKIKNIAGKNFVNNWFLIIYK